MTNIKIIKRTKSVATLGPTTNDIEKIKQLVENGATCARLNFSHGSHVEHAKRIDMIREVAKQKHIPIAIMLDTKGPEVRTHTFKNGSVEIKNGATVDIVVNEEILGTAEKFSVNYPNLAKDIKINDNLLVDDGKLTLKVDAIKAHTITCRALNTHTIKDRRAINIPNVKLSLDFISEKDKADLIFGCQKKVDYVAASFVCSAVDIKAIRAVLDANDGKHIQIIAKIEAQLAVEHFDQILEVTDAIMVARGDLGVEIPFEQVPFLEKEWIKKCRLANKPVIVATQMLDSMITNPHPTRAEVTDVWVAVEWGATCTMLSGESANGNYPVLAVATMSKIIADAESHCNDNRSANALLKHKDKKIVDMMKIVTKEKPRYLITNEQNHNFVKIIANASLSFNIIVLVDNMIDYNKFALNAGIYPFLVDKKMTITLNNSKELLVAINKSYDILPKTKIVIIDSNNKKPIITFSK